MRKSIALFGATGMVGAELLKKLLDQGHCVKALVRDPAKITEANPHLIIIRGDVMDYGDVEQCIAGTEAVYVCLGTWGNKPTQVYSMGTENIIDAMKKFGIRRIICLSSAGIFGKDGGFFGRVIVPLTLWRPFRDKRKQAELLSVSGLDWTLVRPAEIKPEHSRGQLTVSYNRMVKASVSILTLLDFLTNELQNQYNIGKMPILGD